MKLLKFSTVRSPDELLSILRDGERVNRNVRFDDGKKPLMHVTEKNGKVRIRCEMLGGATKDNGFLVGTRFSGRIRVKNGKTTLSGFVTTSPYYHAALLVLLGFFVYYCVKNAGFSVIPICLLILDAFMFRGEFKKQGIIKRYIARAIRRLEEEK